MYTVGLISDNCCLTKTFKVLENAQKFLNTLKRDIILSTVPDNISITIERTECEEILSVKYTLTKGEHIKYVFLSKDFQFFL